MNRPPFYSVKARKIDPKVTPQIDPLFPSVAQLKIDPPNQTGTNMYKNPHKGK